MNIKKIYYCYTDNIAVGLIVYLPIRQTSFGFRIYNIDTMHLFIKQT